MAKEQKFVSVVAYVHNDQAHLNSFLSSVMGKCTELFDKCELILVNDHSTDQSLNTIHKFFEEYPPEYMVSIIRMGMFQGMESSMNAGRDMAIGDYVFEFDDLYIDYDLNMIEKAYRKCLEGNDIVSVASNARMRMTSRWFYKVYNSVSRTQNRIGQATFRLLSRRAINRVKSIGTYIPYRKAVYMNCGLVVARIEYQSTFGKDKLTKHSNRNERTGLAIDSFIYFTNVMEKISLAISAVFLVIAIAVIIFALYSFFMDSHLASGWVSIMGFLSIGFMGIFGLLTIILKYLSVVVNLIFRQQRYLIEDVEKISKN